MKINDTAKLFLIFLSFSVFMSLALIFTEELLFEQTFEKTALEDAVKKSHEREEYFIDFLQHSERMLKSIRELDPFINYMEKGSDESELENIFLAYTKMHPNLMQLRYIDKKGIEKIRADKSRDDHKSILVAKDQLQNKSNRFYFTDSKTKPLEKVWFSNIDLNVEKGKIELPYSPIIRAVLPISHDGQFGGILIINFFMDDFIKDFTYTSLYDFILFDEQGFPLYHYDTSKQWGRYSDPTFNLTEDYPKIIQKIHTSSIVMNHTCIIRKLNLPDSFNGKLYLMLKLKESYINEANLKSTQEHIIITIIIFILSIILSILVVRLFSKKLFNLEKINQLNADIVKLVTRRRIALNAAQVGIWEWDYTHDRLIWDEQMFKIYGIEDSKEKNTYALWRDMVNKDDLPKVEENLKNSIKNLSEFNASFWITTPTGEKKYIKASATHRCDVMSKTNRLIGTNQDITSLKLAEMKYKDLLHFSSEGIHILDKGGNIIECSESFANTLGYTMDEALTLNVTDWEPTVTIEEFRHKAKLVMNTPRKFESKFKRKDGSIFDVEINGKSIDLNGKTYIYAAMRDISDEKKAKKLLEDAKDMAEEAAEVKSRFLANMSHEIRTPLNSIMGFIDYLAKGESDPNRIKGFEVIKNSSDLLLNIVNDILDLTKIEDKKILFEPYPMNIQNTLEETAIIFSKSIEKKNINFVTALSVHLPQCVIIDAMRFKQVIYNLMSNAIKFTPENGTITLETRYENESLSISVIDTGIGIAKENQKKIFEIFTQADTSTTRRYGGTGLGLAISSKLIELMDGELKVESDLGQGSKFYFDIPVESCEEEIDNSCKNVSLEDVTFNGHVLVVEDIKTNQMVMCMILDELGLTYDTANDGVEALEAFDKCHYDLILMDENMPNLNGTGATKKIRELEEINSLKHTPIIAITANAMQGDREHFLKFGMDDYISKPYKEQEIIDIALKYLTPKTS